MFTLPEILELLDRAKESANEAQFQKFVTRCVRQKIRRMHSCADFYKAFAQVLVEYLRAADVDGEGKAFGVSLHQPLVLAYAIVRHKVVAHDWDILQTQLIHTLNEMEKSIETQKARQTCREDSVDTDQRCPTGRRPTEGPAD